MLSSMFSNRAFPSTACGAGAAGSQVGDLPMGCDAVSVFPISAPHQPPSLRAGTHAA